MDYKNNTAARLFLSDDEDEHTKRIFFNLDGYSPITATNSMLYSKSRQLFVYAFN